MRNNSNKSMEDILRDTKHNSKAHEVFLKLIAKQKKPANPFDRARAQTWNPSGEIKPGEILNDTL
ncbi:MAG: hypothetical protein DAHOPDDO_00066 [Ignavibacteriaceae bacterium]|nr:hypothetical protein [Ignavibacteriaceae bacterium]